jgi:AcrR family transcriptional regulator
MSDTIRTTPAQARSASRLDVLLDAAATLLDQAGMDGLTTGALAREAGMSIGSVYRYFADKHAVLRALAQRNMDRYVARLLSEVLPTATNFVDATIGAITVFGDMFRTEPGFRALRFGDRVDEFLLTGSSSNNENLAAAFAQIATTNFGLPEQPDTAFHLNVAVELSDALLTRAFLVDPGGDNRYIVACTELVIGYLVQQFGDPRR